MAFQKFELERKASQTLSELYDQAIRCREAHEKAGLKLPDVLGRLFGDWTEDAGEDNFDAFPIDPLPTPPAPNALPESWVFVPLDDAGSTSLALAILAVQVEPVTPAEITSAASRILKTGAIGNVSNSLSRLQPKGLVEKTNERYSIVDAEKAPIISGEYIWAHPDVLSAQELAAYRRIAVLHILKHFAEGIQTSQVLDALLKADWFKARPLTKDNVRGDLNALEQSKAAVRFSDGKWALPQHSSHTGGAM